MKIWRHIAFWLVYCTYFYIQSISPGSGEEFADAGTYRNAFISLYCFIPVCVLSVYTSIYFILPDFIERKKYGGALLAFVLLFSTATLINFFAAQVFFSHAGYVADNSKAALTLGYLNTIWAMIISGYAIGLRLGRKWFLQQKEIEEITKRKNRNELKLKKNSMQSEFLYSSLGSLHERLSRGDESSSKMILILSNLLSYSLYESKTEKVSLQSELTAVKDFIVLSQMTGSKRIEVNVDSEIETGELLVPPMVLLAEVQKGVAILEKHHDEIASIAIDIGEDEDDLIVAVRYHHLTFQPGEPDPSTTFNISKNYSELYEPA